MTCLVEITKEQFIKEYVEKSGISVEWLEKHNQVAEPCECDYEHCRGWQMVTKKKHG